MIPQKPFTISQLRQMGVTEQELHKVMYHRNNLNHPGRDAWLHRVVMDRDTAARGLKLAQELK